MSDNKIKALVALERKRVEIIGNLVDVELDITTILSKFHRFNITSQNGSGEYEDGRHVMNVLPEKFKGIKDIVSNHKGTFIILEDESKSTLEEYFSTEEIESKMKLGSYFSPEEIKSIRNY